jgi:hypothetical protein
MGPATQKGRFAATELPHSMRSLWIVLFAMTAGFTASGIVASLYRICRPHADTQNGWLERCVVLSIAGPTVIFETAVRGFTRKDWTPFFFWLVAAGLAYWSLAIGLVILGIAARL